MSASHVPDFSILSSTTPDMARLALIPRGHGHRLCGDIRSHGGDLLARTASIARDGAGGFVADLILANGDRVDEGFKIYPDLSTGRLAFMAYLSSGALSGFVDTGSRPQLEGIKLDRAPSNQIDLRRQFGASAENKSTLEKFAASIATTGAETAEPGL